jgi:hypothetical protein
MDRITLRLPGEIVAAFDRAEGNRSELMRARLTEAVADGEIETPEEYQILAERQQIVTDGDLARKRGRFRERAHDYFADRWATGAVTPYDMDDLAETWRQEGALYGEDYLAFIEAMVGFYGDNWHPSAGGRPDWPEPGHFLQEIDAVDVDVTEQLIETMKQAKRNGRDRKTAIRTVSKWHPDSVAEQAASEVWDA